MFCKIRLIKTSYFIILLASGLFILNHATALADEILLYDGKKISGEIRAIDAQTMTVQVGNSSQKVNLFDITSYQFIRPALPKNISQLLIDGEKPSYSLGPKTAKVKLRKGLHRFTLTYFHTVGFPKLNVMMSGPGMKKAKVPQELLFKVNQEVRAIPSKDYRVDKEGYRLPLDLKQKEKHIAYRLMEWKSPSQVKKLRDLKLIPVKNYGVVPRLELLSRRSTIHFGFVYEGLLQIKLDGEYTFYIETDKNSKAKFYIGAYPSELYKQAKGTKGESWSVTFSQKGKLTGNIKSWDQDQAVFQVQVAEKEIEIPIKPTALHELWKTRSSSKKSWRADRKGESKTEDSAYILTKDGSVQRVTGKVVGIRQENLLFFYQGQERKVGLNRVVGLVLHKNRFKEESMLTLQNLVGLIGSTRIPGEMLLENDSTVVIKMPWGGQVSLSKNYLGEIKTINARSVPLTEMIPESVTQVPFFNQIYPYQVNQAFTGLPLKIGSKVFRKGLCVHSKTVLVYSLEKNFEQFQTNIGLQDGSGKLGNVDVKILADGKTIYEKKELTAATKQAPLNLDVKGCEKLTLIVDFGKGQDVGDRFVWGEPKLFRVTPKELAVNKN